MKRALIGIFLFFLSTPAVMSAESPTEYQIKAAFLYNFIKFVEWPAEAAPQTGGEFVVGVLGDDPFGNDLDAMLSGKSVQDDKITLIRISNVQDAKRCQVLFIAGSEEWKLDKILKALEGRPILVVSDISGFVRRGGTIGFTMEGNKVRFSINNRVAETDHLTVSSQLLKLATTVEEPSGDEDQ